MLRIENDCVDCGREEYCSTCSLRRVSHYYCDKCKCELDPLEIYIEDDMELCDDCLKELHLKEAYSVE